MVFLWPPNRQAVIFCRCGFFFLSSSFFLFSSPILSGCTLDVYHTSTRCGRSANLERRSEICCTRLAEKYRTQKFAKHSPSSHHRTTLSNYIFAAKACIDNRKNLLNSYISSTCPHNDELRLTDGWDQLAILGPPPANFNGFRVLATTPTSLNGGQPNFARCLAVSWTSTLYIHFWGLLPLNGIFPGAIFTLRPSLAFSYICSVTARHSSSGR